MRLLARPIRRLGFDFELRSFYSPIPDLALIDESVWTDRSELPGIDLDLDAQLTYLEQELAPFIAEFSPPRGWTAEPTEFYLENGLFQAGDAELLYAMIRRHKPAVLLELGAGFSTLVAAAAVRANRVEGHNTRLISCDPYASATAASGVDGLSELRPIRAERLEHEEIARLQEGDILFIDSSHTVRVGGDVVHLLCDVVPRLRSGVLVHVHDIYLPYQYPRPWFSKLHWYWAEQSLLQALLCGNRDLEVLIAAHALFRERLDRLAATIPSVRNGPAPLSFWMGVR